MLSRGNQLLFTVGWFDWTTNDTVRAETHRARFIHGVARVR